MLVFSISLTSVIGPFWHLDDLQSRHALQTHHANRLCIQSRRFRSELQRNGRIVVCMTDKIRSRPFKRLHVRLVVSQPSLVCLSFGFGWNDLNGLLDAKSRIGQVDRSVWYQAKGDYCLVPKEERFEIAEDEDTMSFCSGTSCPSQSMDILEAHEPETLIRIPRNTEHSH